MRQLRTPPHPPTLPKLRMAQPMNRPCLDCGQLTPNNSRCPNCRTRRERNYRATRPHPDRSNRPHHTDPTYRRISKQLREQWNTNPLTQCWLCGEYKRVGDPWQADHYLPGDPTSPLLPAHRSCNARRGNRTP